MQFQESSFKFPVQFCDFQVPSQNHTNNYFYVPVYGVYGIPMQGSGDKSKPILGQKQAINFRTILDPTLLKK